MNSKDVIHKIVHLLEMVIIIAIGIGVVLGIPDLFRYLMELITLEGADSFLLFQEFLHHALLLIVGIEFILMIVTDKLETILSLVVFVIARKLLIYSEGTLDLLFGTIAVCLPILVMKYVKTDKKDNKNQ
ncbi:MAG: hypothetical protein GXZ08_07565 [Tissierellia bacterium]|nr:hypothetical protein [Tissierellia bacterium]